MNRLGLRRGGLNRLNCRLGIFGYWGRGLNRHSGKFRGNSLPNLRRLGGRLRPRRGSPYLGTPRQKRRYHGLRGLRLDRRGRLGSLLVYRYLARLRLNTPRFRRDLRNALSGFRQSAPRLRQDSGALWHRFLRCYLRRRGLNTPVIWSVSAVLNRLSGRLRRRSCFGRGLLNRLIFRIRGGTCPVCLGLSSLGLGGGSRLPGPRRSRGVPPSL